MAGFLTQFRQIHVNMLGLRHENAAKSGENGPIFRTNQSILEPAASTRFEVLTYSLATFLPPAWARSAKLGVGLGWNWKICIRGGDWFSHDGVPYLAEGA